MVPGERATGMTDILLYTAVGVALTALLVASVAVGIVRSHKNGPVFAGAVTATSTATTTLIVMPPQATNTSSKTSQVPQQISFAATKPVPTQSAPVVASNASPSMTSPAYTLCTANDITGKASWTNSSGVLLGTLAITNSSRFDCSLSHDDYLQISSGNSLLAVGQPSSDTARGYSDLRSGESVAMPFAWGNWCAGPLSSSVYVKLILPGRGGYLQVPVITSLGRPQSDTPSCAAPGANSVVSLW